MKTSSEIKIKKFLLAHKGFEPSAFRSVAKYSTNAATAAQRHQTLQAPSRGPSKQILAQGANSASLAPPARLVEGRGREGKKRHTFEALNLREAGARLAPFAPCAKICSDGSGLGACQVWWRCAAGKEAHSCS